MNQDEITSRAETFVEYLAEFGLFVAGSSGVQGEWPKLLMTRAKDGLLYLDHALPDSQAREHYIIKFSRGPNERLASILRHESAYMQIARFAGLRVHASAPWFDRSVLFIPRFDLSVHKGSVIRHPQESLASLLNLPGFDSNPTHNQACMAICNYCASPIAELAEYVCRDVLNLALGNKDNHARNTAFTRNAEKGVQLTPLYDLAPMVLHPDGIARRMRWEGEEYSQPQWEQVLAWLEHLLPGSAAFVTKRLLKLIKPLSEIHASPEHFGIEPELFGLIEKNIAGQIRALQALKLRGR